MNPTQLRNAMVNFRVIEVWDTSDGPAVDIVVNPIVDHAEVFEQEGGKVAVLGNDWSLLGNPVSEISNAMAYGMMNKPGFYVRLPHPNHKLNTFVVAYHPPVSVDA